MAADRSTTRAWVTRSVVGIILATFFSDVGHEMVTAVLPMYLSSVGLGAAVLGVMEGSADLLFSLSKLAGGFVGHHVEKKRPWATLGYLTTTIATGAIALVRSVAGLIPLRAIAWFGRGFRSPLRDFLLSDEVGPTHFGRAYGMERSADMLGAVAGPLVAVALVAAGVSFRSVILISIVPSMISVASIFGMTRDRHVDAPKAATTSERPKLPAKYWAFLGGVFLFGLGDFSRTFLIFLAARALGETGHARAGLSIAVLLYAAHNAVSAIVAYPVGRLGDRGSKLRILVAGYLLGVVTNAMLAFLGASVSWLVVAILISGAYIAVEETLEKAVVAETLPRELRSMGFGILAGTNAIGDMGSSLYVGLMLDRGHPTAAFALPAAVGLAGVLWMAALLVRETRQSTRPQSSN
ncbi:MAG: putative transporter [bacterium]|nr:putative transporter [bacterium]